MSVTIRLAKVGKRNAPAYKVVVANTKDKRNGVFLDILGYFNPSNTAQNINIDKTKYTEWKNKGALSTAAVDKLIEGKYTFKKYNPKAETKEETAQGE